MNAYLQSSPCILVVYRAKFWPDWLRPHLCFVFYAQTLDPGRGRPRSAQRATGLLHGPQQPLQLDPVQYSCSGQHGHSRQQRRRGGAARARACARAHAPAPGAGRRRDEIPRCAPALAFGLGQRTRRCSIPIYTIIYSVCVYLRARVHACKLI